MRRKVDVMDLEVFIPITMFALIGWTAYQVQATRREHARLQTETRKQLLERLGSTAQLSEFLGTEQGDRFMELFENTGARPHGGLLGLVRAGIILAVVGLGVVTIGFATGDLEGPVIGGGIMLAIGAGCLLAAFVSHRVGERLGIGVKLKKVAT